MPRFKWLLALSAIFVSTCWGRPTHHFWTYPEPYLPRQQEALLITLDSWGLRAIDGKAVDERNCTRDIRFGVERHHQCIHHLRPGKHVVAFGDSKFFSPDEREFTAVAGQAYGLVAEDCENSYDSSSGIMIQTCRVLIREVAWPGEGGSRPLPFPTPPPTPVLRENSSALRLLTP